MRRRRATRSPPPVPAARPRMATSRSRSSWLRAASAGAAPADEFDAMIGYATSKGWVDVDAQTVRAHLA